MLAAPAQVPLVAVANIEFPRADVMSVAGLAMDDLTQKTAAGHAEHGHGFASKDPVFEHCGASRELLALFDQRPTLVERDRRRHFGGGILAGV